MIPHGTEVNFTWKGDLKTGVVEDHLTFNGRTRYGIFVPEEGWLYDVWPNTSEVWPK